LLRKDETKSTKQINAETTMNEVSTNQTATRTKQTVCMTPCHI